MKNVPQIVAVLGIGLLILFVVVALFGGWGMTGWGIGPGMMHGWGGVGPPGLTGMLGMLLIPIGFLALVGICLPGLAIAVTAPPTIGQTCPSCSRAVRASDQYCSNCGAALKK